MSRPYIRQVRNSMFTQTQCFATGKESARFIRDGAHRFALVLIPEGRTKGIGVWVNE